MIAEAITLAATPSLRRCADIGRPLFAAARAILAVILCPVSVSPPNKIRRHRNPGSERGSPCKWCQDLSSRKKMNTATKEPQPHHHWHGVRHARKDGFRCPRRGSGNDRATLYTLSLIAIFLTGYVGYCGVEWFWPGFYYSPIKDGKNVWLFMQSACMVVYTAGVLLAFNRIGRTSQRWRDQH